MASSAPRSENDPPPLRGRMDRRETVHLDELEWVPSPGGEVDRKRLHRVGPAEAGQVTSLVRYPAGSRFPAHDHPEGEEIFVLEGVFSDHQGDFTAGTHLFNPEGFRHAPGSEPGCVIFVKLRQYDGRDRPHRVTHTDREAFSGSSDSPVETLLLDDDPALAESTRVERWPAGTGPQDRAHSDGAEILVYEGELEDDTGVHPAPAWLRLPAGSRHRAWSGKGCRLYVKEGAVASLRSAADD